MHPRLGTPFRLMSRTETFLFSSLVRFSSLICCILSTVMWQDWRCSQLLSSTLGGKISARMTTVEQSDRHHPGQLSLDSPQWDVSQPITNIDGHKPCQWRPQGRQSWPQDRPWRPQQWRPQTRACSHCDGHSSNNEYVACSVAVLVCGHHFCGHYYLWPCQLSIHCLWQSAGVLAVPVRSASLVYYAINRLQKWHYRVPTNWANQVHRWSQIYLTDSSLIL